MADIAQQALRRAAERASRRVELEVALDMIQRTLGYEIQREYFPWVDLLSMPYIVPHMLYKKYNLLPFGPHCVAVQNQQLNPTSGMSFAHEVGR